MLTDTLRAGAHGKVFKILFWIIILSFVFAGVGNYLIPRLDTSPAKVGDYSIREVDWNEHYQQRVRMLMQNLGPRASQYLEDKQFVEQLRMQVLESLIDGVALNNAAHEAGIRIGDDEVRSEIRRLPYFQKDGKFDNDLYLTRVRNLGASPESFAEQLRVELLGRAVMDPLTRLSALTLPSEVENLAALLTQTRTLDIYEVKTDLLKPQITVDDAEVRSCYQSHPANFTKPALASFNYVLLSVDELKSRVKVDDEQIENYYNQHQDEFQLPEQRALSHLLIKTGDNMAERVARVEERLKAGEDFSLLCREMSDDRATAVEGGSMGVKSRAELADNLGAALFALKQKGEVSAPLADESGTHFIRLDEIIAAHVPPLSEVKDQARERYIASEARRLFAELAATLTDVSYENPDSLDPAAKALELPVRDAGAVRYEDHSLPWPVGEHAVQQEAFKESVRTSGQNSSVVNLGDDAAVVLNVYKYEPEKLQPFEEVESAARELAFNEKLAARARELLEEQQKKLTADPDAALPEQLEKHAAVLVRRDGSAAETPLGPQTVLAAFALSTDTPGASRVIEAGSAPLLLVLKAVGHDDRPEMAQIGSSLPAQLVPLKLERARQDLYDISRSLSKVDYNREAIALSIEHSSAP